mmetsp:Transcript_1108/g.4756  ORF Transcript_1108/g.4756 Transcript_1108/m.4756 type:complete len:290 (+) Transcript_1108:3-872(+)
MGDEEAGETVADLPRFEADAQAIREADLRAAAAATSARGDPTGAGAPRLGNGKPRITTTAPWAMGARAAPPARQRRTAAPWVPPAPGKPGTSPEKRSGVGLGSVSELGKSLAPHQSTTTAPLPPPPPPPPPEPPDPSQPPRHPPRTRSRTRSRDRSRRSSASPTASSPTSSPRPAPSSRARYPARSARDGRPPSWKVRRRPGRTPSASSAADGSRRRPTSPSSRGPRRRSSCTSSRGARSVARCGRRWCGSIWTCSSTRAPRADPPSASTSKTSAASPSFRTWSTTTPA